MKRLLFIILILLISLNVKVYASVDELYDVNFQRDIVSDTEWISCNAETNKECRKNIIDKYWQSNNDRIFTRNYIMDNDRSTLKRYMYWSNTYSDSISETAADKRSLAENEYLTIIIDKDKNGNALNIDTSQYQDIRLNIDYMAISSSSLVNSYAFKMFLLDSKNNEHGPYYLGDYQFTGYYSYNYGTSSEGYNRGYKLVSENLKGSKNIVIKKIKIIPFGNTAMRYTFKGDWAVNEGSSFVISEISMEGYKNAYYKNPNVELVSFNVNETRANTARRMFDLATIKWSPEHDINDIRNIGSTRLGKTLYTAVSDNKRNYYYGPPYSQVNRVTVEKFYSALDSNKILPYLTDLDANGNPVQSANTLGNDCSESVSTSVTKFVPLTDSNGSANSFLNRNKTTILGNLKIDTTQKSTKSVYEYYYDYYSNQISNNTVDNTTKSNYQTMVNQRIKSNDLRVFYGKTIGDDNSIYHWLGYTNKKTDESSNGIDGENPLTLTIDNLNIESSKSVDLSFNYIRYDDKVINENSLYADTLITSDKAIIKFCSDDGTCMSADDINVSEPTILYTNSSNNKKINMYTISTSIITNKKVTSVQIMPHGNTFTNLLFRLYDIKINVSNNQYYYNSASRMSTLFDFNNSGNFNTNSLIKEELLEKINNTISTIDFNKMLAKYLANQTIFKGYSELVAGDIVDHHYPNDDKLGWTTHIRIITGSTHVECLDGTVLELEVDNSTKVASVKGSCDSHLGINAAKSYFIRTDINSAHTSTTYLYRNNFGGLVNNNDYVINWTHNSNYTDIENFNDLQDKNLNYYINTKDSFEYANNIYYLPIRYNIYIEGKTEKPYVQYINGNKTSDIKNGFKGSIYSNYRIIAIKFHIKNLDTGSTYDKVVYPEYRYSLTGKYNVDTDYPQYTVSGAVEGTFGNSYSLYYNTPEEVQNKLKEILKNTDNYEVIVTMDAGTSENMQVLSLKTYTITADANGGTIKEANGWNVESDNKTATNIVVAKENYGLLPIPTREGYIFNGWYTAKNGGKEVLSTTVVNTAVNYTMYARWTKIEDIFEKNNYNYVDDKKVIIINESNIDSSRFNEQVQVTSDYRMQIELEDGKNKVHTGSTTKIYKNNELILTIINIIKGDPSGDGKINSLDYVRIKNHIMGSKTIEGNEYIEAADYNNDNKISSLDYVKIKNYIMSNN